MDRLKNKAALITGAGAGIGAATARLFCAQGARVCLLDANPQALKDTQAVNDQLDEVVDYDFVRQVVHQRVAQGHIGLQETLCDDIMAALLAHPGVQAAQVSTRKPDVYPDCEAVGVEIFRAKPGVL
jgi:dihydroneopterin aldolase